MKNILIILFSLILFISCYKVIKVNGIVQDIKIEKKYDPIIHMNRNVKFIYVMNEDTSVWIKLPYNQNIQIGDSFQIYQYH